MFSQSQQAVIDRASDAVRSRTPLSLMVRSVAGSGKTKTAIGILEACPARSKKLALAFNKAAAEEIKARAEGIKNLEVKTINSAGDSLLRTRSKRLVVKADKISTDTAYLAECDRRDGQKAHVFDFEKVVRLVTLAKARCLIPNSPRSAFAPGSDAWNELCARYDVDADGSDIRMAKRILAMGIRNTNYVDFDDQCYLPVVHDISSRIYDIVVVDEAQDLSPAQQDLVGRFLRPGGVIVFVGDEAQAIYGFRGADSEGMETIARRYGCVRMELDVSHRCSRAIVAEAAKHCRSILASDHASEGTVREMRSYSTDDFEPSDMVVCRNTAPLVSLGIQLILAGRPALLADSSLVPRIRSLAKATIERGDGHLDEWLESTRSTRSGCVPQWATDLADCVRTMISQVGCDMKAIDKRLVQLETGDGGDPISLNTIHKAKGLEADRVWFLGPSFLPSPWAKAAWELAQERNLAYVAVTRARSELIKIEPGPLAENMLQAMDRRRKAATKNAA